MYNESDEVIAPHKQASPRSSRKSEGISQNHKTAQQRYGNIILQYAVKYNQIKGVCHNYNMLNNKHNQKAY